MVLFRCMLVTTAVAVTAVAAADKRQAPGEGDFSDRSSDGSYAYRYADRNQFHVAAANKDNVVSGRYGSRSPETGRIVQTSYSAGPRGFRARGPDIARQADLSQARLPYTPPVPTDSSKYDPAYDRYHDPNEDPSYAFTVRTPTQSKSETADSRGHVEGVYSYLDDVGKRHDVRYEAGAGTGFHVKSPHPDSEPLGGAFYSGPPGKPGGRPRGHSSVVLGKDGSYGFTASGPDQRRTEVSDADGRVHGSYTYLDDKGVQRTVQYVAGPDIGYRVVNNAAATSGGAIPVQVQPTALLQQPASGAPSTALLPIPAASSAPAAQLSPSAYEQDLFGPGASTSAAPASSESGGGASAAAGATSGDESFLSAGSAVPVGSAFPEDDPGLPVKKWPPTAYKNKDEESFFRPFEKLQQDRRREQNGRPPPPPPRKTFGVPADSSGYGGGPLQPSTFRPDAVGGPYASVPRPSTARPTAPAYTLYGQPARPIVVVPDDGGHYGQYGGTDYRKPAKAGGHEDDAGLQHGGGRLPPGVVVKARVQSLDILPFGYRVPSPSYVFEKQFGAADGDAYQNLIKK